LRVNLRGFMVGDCVAGKTPEIVIVRTSSGEPSAEFGPLECKG
jgi:hypothetical protein